jgi:uncharacterized membrane protein YphA (DoxX/SURF4 family)
MDTTSPASNGSLRFALLFRTAASHLQSLVLLIIRLAWGWELYLSGYRHLTHFSQTVDFFKSLHIPIPAASVAISGTTEMVGGLLLMAGLGARFISLPLVFNFCVAYATASIDSLKQLVYGGQYLSPRRYDSGRRSALEAVINDDAFPFLVTSLVMIAFGAGKISLDCLLARTIFRKTSAELDRVATNGIATTNDLPAPSPSRRGPG